MDKNGGSSRVKHSVYTATVGQSFGMWTVIDPSRISQPGSVAVLCRCECGVERLVSLRRLNRGTSTSCGCFAARLSAQRLLTHGGSYTQEYYIWRGVLKRCNDSSCSAYPNYGGRGITVCEEWRSFENFLADMGKRPSSDLSIERRDNEGPYSKDNCYWATWIQQNNNTRRCKPVLFDGKTQTVSEWAREYGIKPSTLQERLKRGWSMFDALNIGVRSLTDNRNGGYKFFKECEKNNEKI